MRYRLRTLLILLAFVPPLLWIGWGNYQAWKAEQDRRAALLKQQLLAPRGRPTIITVMGPIPQEVLPPGMQIITVPMQPTPDSTQSPTPFRLIPSPPQPSN